MRKLILLLLTSVLFQLNAQNKNGEVKSYYESGKLKSIVNYENDLVQGELKEYYESGKIKFTLLWQMKID